MNNHFDEHMEDLEEYKSKFDNCDIPKKEGYESLNRWVDNMHQANKGHGHNTFTKDMKDHLNAIDFKWEQYKGNDGYMEDLEAYQRKFGDCCVPQRKKGYESL